MMGVAKQYVQLELPAFALTCLMLMPHSEKRHQQIKVLCMLFLLGCQDVLPVPRKSAFPVTRPIKHACSVWVKQLMDRSKTD